MICFTLYNEGFSETFNENLSNYIIFCMQVYVPLTTEAPKLINRGSGAHQLTRDQRIFMVQIPHFGGGLYPAVDFLC